MPTTTAPPERRLPRRPQRSRASEARASKRRRPPSGGRWLGLALTLAAGALLLAAAAHWAAGQLWLADLAATGRNLLVAAAAGLLLATLVLRRFGAAALAAAALAANAAALILPGLAAARATTVVAGSAPLEVATFNAAWDDEAFDAFADWARRDAPEIIALSELSDGWRRRLPELIDAYPYRASRLIEGDLRQDILSRSPMREAHVYRPLAGRTAPAAEIETIYGPLRVVVLNPPKPLSPRGWQARNAYLALAGQWAGGLGGHGPQVVAGSWYVTPWSPVYAETLRYAGVQSLQSNVWPQATHGPLGATASAWFGNPIDHIAASSGVRSGGCRVGPQLGAEYAPLICRLRL